MYLIFQVGFHVEVNDRRIHFHGALHLALGDTPAAAAIGGFKEGVGFAKNKCRRCSDCQDDKMQNKFKESDFTLLDKATYETNCTTLLNAETDIEFRNLSKEYGLNRRSVMLECPDYDLTQSIPMDIMHVMQEGVMEYEIKCILKVCVEEKLFSVEDFNEELEQHFGQFRKDAFDKPKLLTRAILNANDNKLRQGSATKMLTLARGMPFILNKLIKQPTEIGQYRLRLVQQLLEISHFMFAPVIGQDRVERMADQIEEHLKLFKEVFPERRIMPKQHYMLHIPRNIAQFGPAFRFSTSRFESEHRPHKRHIVHQQNYKNVAFSIVESSQLEDSVAAESPKGEHPMFKLDLVPGKVVPIAKALQPVFKRRLNAAYPEVQVDKLISMESTKFVTVCGQKYVATYSFVACGVKDNMLTFGKVNDIFLIREQERPEFTHVVLELCMYRTVALIQKLQAYKVEKDPLQLHRQLVVVEDLVDYCSYDACLYRKRQYIPLQHEVEGIIKLHNAGHIRKHNQLQRRGRY